MGSTTEKVFYELVHLPEVLHQGSPGEDLKALGVVAYSPVPWTMAHPRCLWQSIQTWRPPLRQSWYCAG
eukprot:5117678-Alexandrium_andersonii.AAC.1